MIGYWLIILVTRTNLNKYVINNVNHGYQMLSLLITIVTGKYMNHMN